MERVSLLRCENYDVDLIEKKIREGFELLGGEEYVRKVIPFNSKVMLKPNMLSVEGQNSIVVTNHKFFEAVIRVLKDYSSDISFGDSPGFGDAKKAAEKIGLLQVAERYGVKYADFNDSTHVKLEDSILCRSWTVAKAPYESDVLITIPRIKTHAMAFYTGAIKNQFGCIPGTLKAAWHTRMPDANNFCKMLLDLNTLVGTSFAIVDGIVAMQGNGPKSGTPYDLKSIVMGKSPSAVDSVAVRLIGYKDPLETPVLKEAYDSKWGVVLPEDIEVVGEKIEDLKAKDFELCRKGGNFFFMNPQVNNFLRTLIAPNPILIEDKCISCRRCQEVCPEKPRVIQMVDMNGKLKPTWNMKECIRCFCCQELCPAGAIETRHAPLGRLIYKKRR